MSKLAAGLGGAGVALALTAGAGVASADPLDAATIEKARHPAIAARMDLMRAPMMGLHFPSLRREQAG